MKTSRLSLLICLTLLAACGTPTDPSTEPVSFTHTVSFGFCPPSAYCSSRLDLSPQDAVVTYESRQGSPTQVRLPGAAHWTRVSGALDAAGLRALPDVVGCPDCADGGAESVAVTFGDGQVDRVTFEYNDDVRGIEEVVDALREVRRSFPTPPPTAPAP